MQRRKRWQELSERGSYFEVVRGEEHGYPGKVLKTLQHPFKPGDAQELKEVHERYLDLMESRGVKVLRSEIISSNIDGLVRLTFVQNRVPQNKLLNIVFERAPGGRVLELFRRMLEISIEYHRKGSGRLEPKFDPKPQNFALINNDIVLIDTFPPLIKEVDRIIPSNAFEILSRGPKKTTYRKPLRPFSGVLDIITSIERRRLAKRFLRNGFGNPVRSHSSLLIGAIRARPDLKRQFIAATRAVLQREYGSEQQKIIKAIEVRARKLQRAGIFKQVLRK